MSTLRTPRLKLDPEYTQPPPEVLVILTKQLGGGVTVS